MSTSYFQFKQFTIHQDRCAMKVTTDACLFGAWAAERVRSQESGVKNILDIGTGTGLLSLMQAQQCNASIDTIEIEKDTFEQAGENIAASLWADRIKVFQGDARAFRFPVQYDIIISNPPFYEKDLMSDNTKKNLAHHNEGLFLSELLVIIKKNLQPDGSFYLLMPYKRKEEIRKLFIETDLSIQQLTFLRQSADHNYFRIMLAGKLKTKKQAETMIDEISIKDKEGQYTPFFVKLLKDYYLYL